MTTFVFVLVIFFATIGLIYQHRCYEKERCQVMGEMCELLETLEREVASLSTQPLLSGLEEKCPILVERGVLSALAKTEDIGLTLSEMLRTLPLPEAVGEMLVGYFSSFGHGERSLECESCSQLLARMRTLTEEEKEASKNRERAFEVVVASCALCLVILLL